MPQESKRALLLVLAGFLLLAGMCGAAGKVLDEGWNGPSSKPGAVHRR
jgi:hypothetical protein